MAHLPVPERASAAGRSATFHCLHGRLYLPRELNALVERAGGFRTIGWYGNFRKNQPLDYSSNAIRAIAIYQRLP